LGFLLILISRVSQGQEIDTFSFNEYIRAKIPDGWVMRDSASGDLNKDGHTDCVIVIQNTDPSFYQTENNSFGYDSINSNVRRLLIFFRRPDGFYLVQDADKIIPEHVSPTIDDPYGGIAVEKGVLYVGYHFWANAGSWIMFNTTYKFRFQDGDFYLIGIEYNSTHRASMENNKVSINFSTRKMLITKTYQIDEEVVEESEWKKFQLDKLYSILEVYPTGIQVLDEYY
jgi:hypothetical protein